MKNQICIVLIVLTAVGCTSPKVEKTEVLDLAGYTLTPQPFNEVQLDDKFWKLRLETQLETLVPFALDKTRGAVRSLEMAANYTKGIPDDLPKPHRYETSDLYKVMEGAAYLLMDNRNLELESRMDSIINIIADAQQEDGYLYVAHITGVSKDHDHWGRGGMGDKPYSFVLHSHELYNMGHMYEAAIAYYQATGKDKWLKVAEKNAQHVNKVFFEGDSNYNDGKAVNTPPGHQEMELALTKLYRLTGKDLYLEMAQKFLDIRGRENVPDGEGLLGSKYSQQHKPVAEQTTAVGHAVRATYLYSGMADVSALAATDEYGDALDNIWHDIVDTKMPITGGLGAIHSHEGFGPSYELPNKEAYNETCAAVGNVFFNYRMFLLSKDARYMDVAEIALFNNALAGVNIEGNRFFYVNPLEADGVTPFNHGNAGRSPWFGTACCPSNIARLMPQVSGLMYAYAEDEIFTLLYASNSTSIPLEAGTLHIKQESDYPFDGKVSLTLTTEKEQNFTLKLRIPTWAHGDQFVPGELYHYANAKLRQNWSVKVNGVSQELELDKGFAVINRKWQAGDEVVLELPLEVRFNIAHEKVEAGKDRVAITRGPLVYCAEGFDNGGSVDHFILQELPESGKISASTITEGILANVTTVDVPFHSRKVSVPETVHLIPYYAWNNRDEGSMIVWFPTN